MSDSLQIHELYPTRLLWPWNSPGNDTRVGCHFLLQRVFPNQGLNPGFLHFRQILYSLSHQRRPNGPLLFKHQDIWAYLGISCHHTQGLTLTKSLGWEDPLEEGIVSHSSILAWRISWTEKPGRLQSIGLHRVRDDWSSLARASVATIHKAWH